MPRLSKVSRGTLAVAAGGSACAMETTIEATNSETMRLLAEILAVADDAQLEGRTSMVDHDSIVQAAGTLRRIPNPPGRDSIGRPLTAPPPLRYRARSAPDAILAADHPPRG